MPDWSSQAELLKDAAVFVKFQHALLGVYAWEWFISLPFDWQVLTGRKRFRWPLIFYFANRYLLLGALIGIAIGFDTFQEINCQSLFTFNQFAGDAAVGLASINLSLRTLAIWSQNMYIKALLVIIILGHWSLILQGVLLDAQWSDELGSCIIQDTNTTILAATFTYSMCFDLIVLLLNAYKLGVRRQGKSRLTKMIFKDGLVFFFIAFLANLIATVFMFLKLNSIMSVVFNVPAAIASTIVATRAVRRLTNFTSSGPEMYQPSGSSTGAMRSHSGTRGLSTTGRKGQPGVHVQMETFVRAEEGMSPTSEFDNHITLKRQPAEQGSVEYDVETKAPAAF
ncbi:hypothetical protein MIND_00510200 [Mycena indigotica]|uniref:Transmembrane protein n=1 Tax=Mycena indigotica TaxID=2126181 RepID=A0A8H6SYV5_9AGAR|nr:uncharacterized protein MIND_00510200 [Mycena indigotica]KAF7307166.1 hypothetical protein MIND_00510200 [Mycena indigotica]